MDSVAVDYSKLPKEWRVCNKYGCGGRMRPAGQPYNLPWMEDTERTKKNQMKDWVCIKCGNVTAWLAFPEPVGAAADFHHIQGSGMSEGFDTASMRSDPRFYPPKPPASGRIK